MECVYFQVVLGKCFAQLGVSSLGAQRFTCDALCTDPWLCTGSSTAWLSEAMSVHAHFSDESLGVQRASRE